MIHILQWASTTVLHADPKLGVPEGRHTTIILVFFFAEIVEDNIEAFSN